MQWRCTAYIIVNSKHTSVSVCVFVCAVYICAHTSRALDVSRCNNIKLYRQPIHILFTSPKIQYKRFLGGTLSLFLSLSSSLRPHSKMKCVLCACGECECEPILTYTFASMHTFMHGMRHWLKQCKSNTIATIVHATNDAMRCCWTVLNRILRNNECSECRAGQNICFGAVEFEIGNESNISVRERLYVWMRVVFSFSILNVHWD